MTVMMLALALGGEPPALRASPTDAKPLAKWSATDLSGNRHTAKDWKDRKAVAFLFVTTECPVAAFYLPEFGKLAATNKDVAWHVVYVDVETDAGAVAKHAREHGVALPTFHDPEQSLARKLGVQTVPEAVVATTAGDMAYRGRIDDRYATSGRRSPDATVHDLRDAVAAVTKGEKPKAAHLPGYGCPLPEAPDRRAAKEKKR
ncbi:MAG TPA: redoxin domain-containing protein [Planctomycetia bacterium]|nr:redoxin domain-containing protein [Planctomycetia bacterium]